MPARYDLAAARATPGADASSGRLSSRSAAIRFPMREKGRRWWRPSLLEHAPQRSVLHRRRDSQVGASVEKEARSDVEPESSADRVDRQASPAYPGIRHDNGYRRVRPSLRARFASRSADPRDFNAIDSNGIEIGSYWYPAAPRRPRSEHKKGRRFAGPFVNSGGPIRLWGRRPQDPGHDQAGRVSRRPGATSANVLLLGPLASVPFPVSSWPLSVLAI